MSAIDRLLSNYSRQVRLPWSAKMAGMQRVWFAVYPPRGERRVGARLPQFEALALAANHGRTTVDLTDLLPKWITAHEYPERIFGANAGPRPLTLPTNTVCSAACGPAPVSSFSIRRRTTAAIPCSSHSLSCVMISAVWSSTSGTRRGGVSSTASTRWARFSHGNSTERLALDSRAPARAA